jgi:ABC-2 type transport system permease protein
MNPLTHAARLGVRRGWLEFRQSLTRVQDQGFNVFLALAIVLTLYFQRDSTLPGTTVSVASATLPGVLGMMVAVGAVFGIAGFLTLEREDGTLLRAKAIPHGMAGYLVARVVLASLSTLLGVLIVVVPGLFLVPELAGAGLGWLTLLWVTLLGLLATLPWGAVIGSVAKGPNALFGLAMLPVTGITAISGIFYPITALPGWLAAVAQVFPVYWMGLGTRSALLPDAAAAAEIGGSWRTLPTLGVLAVWAVAGFVLAPVLLRRMAERESGTNMQERRDQAIARMTG